MDKTTSLKIFAWSLSSIVAAIALFAWAANLQWHLGHISAYRLFPLLGLIAFSVMWSHYIVSALRQFIKVDKEQLHLYIEVTSWVVLVAIFLHPGILEWQLWRDGFGLPPGSVLQNYVAHGLRWAAVLGMVSFLVFLAYELRRKFSRSRWWKFVEYATDAAMVGIFIHSLKLGTLLQYGWLKMVWYFYGATLLIALVYIYYRRFRSNA